MGEGGREGGRLGGMEGWREGWREGGREGWREGGRRVLLAIVGGRHLAIGLTTATYRHAAIPAGLKSVPCGVRTHARSCMHAHTGAPAL